MSVGSENQRVEKAVRKAKAKLAEGVKSEDTEIAVCPHCHHAALVTGTNRGDYCFFCKREYKMVRCTCCRIFVADEETDEYGMCPTCCQQESVIVP